jgi:hypothetical protein
VRFTGRRAERSAVDRHRHLRLWPGRSPRPPVQRARRGPRPRDHDDPIITRTTEELLNLVPRHCGKGRSLSARPGRAPPSA